MSGATISLPSAPSVDLGRGVVLQSPLSRCGQGPGLIILRPSKYADCQRQNESLDPEPIKKWAEESYTVVQISLSEESSDDKICVLELVRTAVDALVSLPKCNPNDKIGLLVYGSQADYADSFAGTLYDVAASSESIVAAVYFDIWGSFIGKPVLLHVPGGPNNMQKHEGFTGYSYPEVASSGFVIPGHPEFKLSSAGIAHSRNLGFLKRHMNAPHFDLEKIWEEHTLYEFGERSVEKTMATMVPEPYVNHVPTLTGGTGHARLSNFYLNHFIFNNPDDTALELISRTVGTDRVVDEFIFCFTHNKQMDWMIPGIPPTGKSLRVPFTSVVNIRGDRLYHEHIAWDQATVLVQLGLMPEYLPYPYALPGGQQPAPGKRFEYRVPAAGVESAEKLANEHMVSSNQMFEYKVREVDN